MQFYHSIQSLTVSRLDNKIKSQIDCIFTILQIVELIQTWQTSEARESVTLPYLHIDTDSLQRVFIVKCNSIVSFGFPLGIRDTPQIEFFMRDILITPTIISNSITLIKNCLDNPEKGLYDVANSIDISNKDHVIALSLFKFLLWSENGYLRYDYDPQHQDAKFHPKHHLDINFSQLCTYKLGLYGKLSLDEFKDIIARDKLCWYLTKNSEVFRTPFLCKVFKMLRW